MLLSSSPRTSVHICSFCGPCSENPLGAQRLALHLSTRAPKRLHAETEKASHTVSDGLPRAPSPLKGMKMKRVERLGTESVAGVAKIDKGDSLQLGRLALLVTGDAAALLLFAAIGRRNHGEGLQTAETLSTALPFLIGWYAVAAITGAYKLPPQRDQTIGRAVGAAARAWALAVPVALALRSVQRGYIPDKSFVIVSFVATGVLLIGWRAGLAAALQGQSSTSSSSQNRQGNPLEFLELLTSLTKRW